ncbi:MAG: [FeFe] hydrogenase H-cluster radical SAM maturase HydE [bacterium]|nr:[FeFe] hydrogenase H-cluster radical SAM maturase HydE [bacterium]
MSKILEKALNTQFLEKSEIVELLYAENAEQIFFAADKVRKEYKGDAIHLRGLIEFSNICKRNCNYCGLRKDNKSIERYRLTKEEILDCTKSAVELGYKTLVLQSGEDSYFDIERLSEIISEIKKYDVAVTLSIGEKTFDEYKSLKLCGADRYLIRIETTDKNLYEACHPDMNFQNRIDCLKYLKNLGYETGSGCLVGLPNQTIESLADDILFFKSINADMIGIGPFIPCENTPFENLKAGDFYLALKVMAIARLLLPDINIPATTAMETLKKDGQILALQSGANVIMPNITDEKHKKLYKIYPNKGAYNEKDNPKKYRDCLSQKLLSIGRFVSDTKGFRKDI